MDLSFEPQNAKRRGVTRGRPKTSGANQRAPLTVAADMSRPHPPFGDAGIWRCLAAAGRFALAWYSNAHASCGTRTCRDDLRPRCGVGGRPTAAPSRRAAGRALPVRPLFGPDRRHRRSVDEARDRERAAVIGRNADRQSGEARACCAGHVWPSTVRHSDAPTWHDRSRRLRPPVPPGTAWVPDEDPQQYVRSVDGATGPEISTFTPARRRRRSRTQNARGAPRSEHRRDADAAPASLRTTRCSTGRDIDGDCGTTRDDRTYPRRAQPT
jgi:hypothetical protein